MSEIAEDTDGQPPSYLFILNQKKAPAGDAIEDPALGLLSLYTFKNQSFIENKTYINRKHHSICEDSSFNTRTQHRQNILSAFFRQDFIFAYYRRKGRRNNIHLDFIKYQTRQVSKNKGIINSFTRESATVD